MERIIFAVAVFAVAVSAVVRVCDATVQLKVPNKYYDYHNERPPRISCTYSGIAQRDLIRVDFFKDGLHFLQYFAGNATKHVLVDLDAVLYSGAEHSTIDFPNRDRHVTGMYRCAVTYVDAYHHMVEEMSGDTELIVVVLPNDLPLLALDVRNGIGPSDTQIVEATCTTGVHSEFLVTRFWWHIPIDLWPMQNFAAELINQTDGTIEIRDQIAGMRLQKTFERRQYAFPWRPYPVNVTVECTTFFDHRDVGGAMHDASVLATVTLNAAPPAHTWPAVTPLFCVIALIVGQP